jgi:hypothetical protein
MWSHLLGRSALMIARSRGASAYLFVNGAAYPYIELSNGLLTRGTVQIGSAVVAAAELLRTMGWRTECTTCSCRWSAVRGRRRRAWLAQRETTSDEPRLSDEDSEAPLGLLLPRGFNRGQCRQAGDVLAMGNLAARVGPSEAQDCVRTIGTQMTPSATTGIARAPESLKIVTGGDR